MQQPERVFDRLVAARTERDASSRNMGSTKAQPRLKLIREREQIALAAASGITATLTPQESSVAPDTEAAFSLALSNKGSMAATIKEVRIQGWQESVNVKFPALLAAGATLTRTIKIHVPKSAGVNLPRAAHLYDERAFGQRVSALVSVAVKDESFLLSAAAQVDVAPTIEVANISPSPYVLTPGNVNQPLSFTFSVINHGRAPFTGRIVSENAADRSGFPNLNLSLRPNAGRSIALSIPERITGSLAPVAAQASQPATKALSWAVYPSRSPRPIALATLPLVYSDARVAPNLRVGYIRSFDDTLRNALKALGTQADELTVDEMRTGDLSRFDTIIIDNRGYQAHPELVRLNRRLLEYTRAGGTLIVFYHKANEWNPDEQKERPQLAPFPITLGSARVTDENAPVTFTDPKSVLLNFPNKIEARDFDNWIQERGMYYPKEWDAHYSAPLSTHDAGESPLGGGLLAADYGRGRYIYTSMVWYRQLRAGIPGAYRVFANMISYGRFASLRQK